MLEKTPRHIWLHFCQVRFNFMNNLSFNLFSQSTIEQVLSSIPIRIVDLYNYCRMFFLCNFVFFSHLICKYFWLVMTNIIKNTIMVTAHWSLFTISRKENLLLKWITQRFLSMTSTKDLIVVLDCLKMTPQAIGGLLL